MLETLLALMMVLAVPLVLVAVVVKTALVLLFLPFKILGFVLKLVTGILGAVFGLVFSGLGLGLAVLAFVAFAVVIPLLPLELLGAGIWLLVRAARPRHAVQVVRAT
jgi:hypothetical protein